MMLQIQRNTLLLVIATIAVLLNGCKEDYSSTRYLEKVIVNLESIKSATYKETVENWFPGDTAPLGIQYRLAKEYDNPEDLTIGSKFIYLDYNNPSLPVFCYDGQMRALIYLDEKRMVLDSFKLNKRPFRPVTPPFLNYTESVLRYALETDDSISLQIDDREDEVYLKLLVYEEQQVEFFGKPYHVPINPYSFGDNTSQYEVWISKSNNLPYKVRRAMSHDISVVICEDFVFNSLNIAEFNASDYFPEGFKIQNYSIGGSTRGSKKLIGINAPDWTLQTADKTLFSLDDLKSKVVMIQFTSVSCGPCKVSIPFLKELSTSYNKEDFDFVAIECATKNTNALKSYMERNDFEYKFLLSNKEVRKNYAIRSFPVFYFLNEDRIIEEVIYGYGEGSTDEKITSLIDEMIDI